MVVLLYALSAFSVLALTVLRNSELEATLRNGADPDLHVVLYAGGAGTASVVGRLNLPTVLRAQGTRDDSAEVRAPGPVGTPLTAAFPAGAAYAVQLSGSLRVCCDMDGAACGSVGWDQPVPQGRVEPPLAEAIAIAPDRSTLQFALSALDVAPNAPLDPNATAPAQFLLRATRVPDGDPPPPLAAAATEVTCSMQTPDAVLATGTLRLLPGVDERGAVTRVSAGSLQLTYARRK